MRILRVAQDLFPDTVGGAPYHVHALSRDQAARGHDVTVLSVTDAVDEPTTDHVDGYTRVRSPPRVTLFGNRLFGGTLRHLRRHDDYDVLHVHSHLFYSSNVAALYGTLDDTPLAVTCHGLGSQRVPAWVSETHLRTLGRLTYDAANITFCYTAAERDRLRAIGVDSPISVVRNGIDTRRFVPDGPTDDRLPDGPVVVFAGRLVSGKRPMDVLQAFRELPDDCDATLVYCGDGPLRAELETAAESEFGDAVRILGHVSYERMPAIYRAADLFVLPSQTEGLPRTVLEALACGTPVVTTRLDQLVPIARRAGRTVPIGGTAELATAMAELLAAPDRLATLGAEGRALVEAEYDWEETVEQTTAALETLTTTRPSRPVSRHTRGDHE